MSDPFKATKQAGSHRAEKDILQCYNSWMIWDASKFLLSDVVIMGLIVLGLTGVFLDLFMRMLGKLIMPWTRFTRVGVT